MLSILTCFSNNYFLVEERKWGDGKSISPKDEYKSNSEDICLTRFRSPTLQKQEISTKKQDIYLIKISINFRVYILWAKFCLFINNTHNITIHTIHKSIWDRNIVLDITILNCKYSNFLYWHFSIALIWLIVIGIVILLYIAFNLVKVNF